MVTAAIETTDWLALKSRIDTLATDPAMQVFEPGAVFTPPANLAPFIVLSDVRNDTDRMGIDPSLHIRSGVLMLSVQWPLAEAVTHAQMVQIGGAIAAHFKADTCMAYGVSRLRVMRDADVMQPYVDGVYRVVTVRVPWWSK